VELYVNTSMLQYLYKWIEKASSHKYCFLQFTSAQLVSVMDKLVPT